MKRLLLLLIAAVGWQASVASARDLRSSDVEAADYPTVKAVAYMDQLLRQRSNSRLKIGSLGHGDQDSESFTIAQLRTGDLDMARLNVAALHSLVPTTVVPALPFLVPSRTAMRRVLDGPVGAEILASFNDHGLVALCFYDPGARSIYTRDRPIRSVKDLAGLRVRVQQSSAMAQVMKALGAQPIPMPYNQVNAALAAGTIDAAENNLASYVTSRHHLVAKVYSLTEHTRPPAVLVFSKPVWDRLPPADQDLIRQAARDSVPYFRSLWEEFEAGVRQTLEASGGQVVEDVDRAGFAQALAPLHARLVRETRDRALLERIKAAEQAESR
ncbi:TRAP transporter substrate-binding protein [Reyranella sp.]|uniref:TRAP transporter substrate-binding protein n=1 Tax=Reyranella sp. TaxID=1929291 RepID=UPI003BAB1CCF